MKILAIHARQILDSRGNPTIETDVILDNNIIGRASVPSGASTGINEAVELRDNNPSLYSGKSVLKAVNNVNQIIAKEINGTDPTKQTEIDNQMIMLDGTKNKSRIGANAILSVSIACAKASALAQKIPLYEYFYKLSGIKKTDKYLLPVPQMNIINGGKHASNSTDIQEFMIMPVGAKTFAQALQMGTEIFHALGKVLSNKGYSTNVGDEGGFAPQVKNGNAEAFELILLAIEKAGYKPGKEIFLALDSAASEFYENGKYNLKKEEKKLSSLEMVDWYKQLINKFPIISLEDGLDQTDWEGWKILTNKLGNKAQIVGDDLFVTNINFLNKGIKEKSANAILIKLNQIGTITETIDAVKTAKNNNWNTIISHRSGETEDTTIADFAVGLGARQIKTGSLCRTDRVAKYNQLLRIEEELGKNAKYVGVSMLKK